MSGMLSLGGYRLPLLRQATASLSIHASSLPGPPLVLPQAAGKFKEEIVPVETIAVTGDGEPARSSTLHGARISTLCPMVGFRIVVPTPVLHVPSRVEPVPQHNTT